MNTVRLKDDRLFVHRVDADERIVFVNDDWLKFGAENQWTVDSARLIGTPLPDYIADPETRHIYGLIITKARAHGRAIRFAYRCDSPECRRLLEMEIQHDRVPDLTEFRSRVLRLESRPSVRLLQPGDDNRSSDILNLCGWCKRAQTDNQWLEVEEVVRRLGLLEQDPLPKLSHGICPNCVQTLEAKGVGR